MKVGDVGVGDDGAGEVEESGLLLMLTRNELEKLKISTSKGMNTIISPQSGRRVNTGEIKRF